MKTRHPTQQEIDESWEATGIRFEKPRMTRRLVTPDMFGKPKSVTKRKAKKSSNKAWIRKAY
jgi:hypothetical protein